MSEKLYTMFDDGVETQVDAATLIAHAIAEGWTLTGEVSRAVLDKITTLEEKLAKSEQHLLNTGCAAP